MNSNLVAENSVVDKTLVAGLLATTFFLPTLFGSISIVVALILALAAFLYFLFSSRLRGVFDWQPTLTALFGVFGLLGVLFAVNADAISDMSFLVSFLGLALPVFLYQYLINLPKPPKISHIAVFCLLGCLIGLLFAHAQHFGLGIYRTVAIAAGSNAVARVAVLLGFLALIGCSLDFRSRQNLVLVAPFFALGIVVLSGSRGALITIPILIVTALIFVLPVIWAKSRLSTTILLVVIAVFAAGFVVIDPNGFVSRVVSTLNELSAGKLPGNSSALRLEMLVGAWNAFQSSPFVGYGWAGHWDALVQSHSTPEMFASVKGYFSYHNDIADFAVAGGIFGLLGYAMLILAPILNLMLDQSLRSNRPVAYALVVLPVSYFIFGLTDFVFGFDLLTTLYGFSLAFVLASAKESSPYPPKGLVEN